MVYRRLKLGVLRALRGVGAFELAASSDWRRQRLLILCYHGTSLEDEHLWRPGLYIDAPTLERRFAALKKGGYSVLPLEEGLNRLRSGSLPRRSVAITFDDGTYDFYRQAFPLLQSFGFPATVYLTTYYTLLQLPVFNLICSYMLWKRRGETMADGSKLGLTGPLDLRTEAGRHKVVRGLIDISERANLTGIEKDGLAARLANLLKLNYEELKAKRILQLMSSDEVRTVSKNGIDVQLHTHRHRIPEDEALFRREINDNRRHIVALGGRNPGHFCYPGGVYTAAFLPWLRQEQVISATTCDSGLAAKDDDLLLLPRFIDNQSRTQVEFESWLAGVGDLLALRRKSTQKYVPHD